MFVFVCVVSLRILMIRRRIRLRFLVSRIIIRMWSCCSYYCYSYYACVFMFVCIRIIMIMLMIRSLCILFLLLISMFLIMCLLMCVRVIRLDICLRIPHCIIIVNMCVRYA